MALQISEPLQCLFQPSRYKALHGGRGGGKSHGIASALVAKGAEKPLRIGCYREVQKSLSTSVKQLLEDKIDQAGLRGFYTSTERTIRGQNGTEFLFGGLRTNPDSVKSTEGLDIAWLEEADRTSQVSLDLLIPTVRKPGSEIWFSWNRKNINDPVDNMFLGGKPPPNSIILQINWRDNPWFPEELRAEMEWLRDRDVDKWRHVWEGDPLMRTEQRVFPKFAVEEVPLGEIPSKYRRPRFGADWGFSIDPTVLVKCYLWERKLYIASEAYRIKCEIDDTPALFAGSDPLDPPRWPNRYSHPGIEGAMHNKIVADGARPETISHMKARGFDIQKAIKGAKSVEEGIEFIKSHDIIVDPSCKHTIDEMSLYGYKVDKLTDEVLPELEDKDNHVIDAVRYALEADRRAKRRGRVSLGGARLIAFR